MRGPLRHHTGSAAALLALLASCGGSPSAPSAAAPPASTPPPATAQSCAAWATTLRATGVPPATGAVVAQRQALYAAGGGIRAVGSRYYAAWFPATWAATSPRRVLFTLHGTGGAPETDWSIDWKDHVRDRSWAYLSLKYVDDATGQHDNETTMYANIRAVLADVAASCDFGAPSLFLVGFSRGSAQTFPIAYLDLKGSQAIRAIGSNSGAWQLNGPLTPTLQGIVDRGETNAYAGARFWLYCGRLDREHGYPMCDEMANAQAFVTDHQGTVERLYEDPTGGHGGLAKNPDATGAMFAWFESLR